MSEKISNPKVKKLTKSFKQYDSRWGSKNYNGSSTMAGAGCGPTSVADLVYNIDKTITPWKVAKWMKSHGYAIRNNGTAHDGIPAALKHYGMHDVKYRSSMKDIFDDLSKGKVAIFLFRGGSRGGITWTTSGHYVANDGYKIMNNKHRLKMFDPGGRDHDGWYYYESQMKGLIYKVWTCSYDKPKPIPKPDTKYAGVIPKPTIKMGSKGTQVINLQKFLNWYFGSAVLKTDGKFGVNTETQLEIFQENEGINSDGIYGKISEAKAKAYK